MKKIKTLEDLQLLRQQKALPSAYIDYLESYYKQIMESLLQYSDTRENFQMDRYNEFILLEAEDDVLAIEGLGIHEEDGKLHGWFEFVNILELNDLNIFQIGVLYDNEFMALFFSSKGTQSPAIEALFEEHAEFGQVIPIGK